MDRVTVLLVDAAGGHPAAAMLKEVFYRPGPFEFAVHAAAEVPSNWCAAGFQKPPALVFVCMRCGDPGCNERFGRECDRAGDVPVVAAADQDDAEAVRAALERGAADFLIPPLRAADVLPRVWRLLPHVEPGAGAMQELKERLGLRQIIGEDEGFLSEVRKVPLLARAEASVLVQGETGTGKEILARAIHYLSARSAAPFVAINCGAIPADLLENELFGHEAGAYTGARGAAPGLVNEAEAGTMFLDEVDSLPPLAQVKVLRLLQEKEYRPLGSRVTRRADVRLISASNAVLAEAVRAGRFRADLFYRLNVLNLKIPPLRQRLGDISKLALHFLAKYAPAAGKPALTLSRSALKRLEFHDWPGNVRELENVIERAVVLAERPSIRAEDLDISGDAGSPAPEGMREAKRRCVNQFECRYIRELLMFHSGNITKAAASAKKNRRAFWALIKKHRLTVLRHPAASDAA